MVGVTIGVRCSFVGVANGDKVWLNGCGHILMDLTSARFCPCESAIEEKKISGNSVKICKFHIVWHCFEQSSPETDEKLVAFLLL